MILPRPFVIALAFGITASLELITVPQVVEAQTSTKKTASSQIDRSIKGGASEKKASVTPDQKLVMDPAVISGTLPNGLRYFIRQNNTPQQRAELRLIVNAGSALEDEDQRGLAHFVEHMAFNGTKSFAKHDIIGYLQSVGMKFGADLNASTSYDETIYKLTVPTDGNGEVLKKGIQILKEWAHDVTFDSLEVMAERGVILEERRMRAGVGLRMAAGRDSALFVGTPYADRLPIGTPRSISEATPSLLKRFYNDWYRPDLMSVVIVGDFNPKEVETLIKNTFTSIPKATKPRPRLTYALHPSVPKVTLLHDNQQQAWLGYLYFPKDYKTPKTAQEYRSSIVDRLLSTILTQRLSQLPRLEKSPIISAQFGVSSLRRGVPAYTLTVQTRQHAYERGIALALAELERIAKFGVTSTELSRASKQMIANVEAGNVGHESRTSADYANDYVQVALNPSAIALSNSAALSLIRDLAPTVTSADLQALARSLRTTKTPLFVGMTPPPWGKMTDSMIIAGLRQVDTMTLTPYEDNIGNAPLLSALPQGGQVVSEQKIESLQITDWTLSNGIRVLLKPTTYSPGRIELQGFKFGGASLAEDSQYINANTSAIIVGMSGAGAFTSSEIQNKLAGTVVSVGMNVGQNVVTVAGRAATQDLTPFFELLYLKFTEPRIDTVAVRNWQSVNRTRGMDAIQLQMNRFLTNENPRGRPIFGRMLDSVNLDSAIAFYRDRFGDATGFTFVLVGDFDINTVKPLIEKYLGGLPAHGKQEMFVDRQVRPKQGPIRHTLTINTPDPVSRSQVVFTGPFEFTRKTQREIGAVATILQMRLTEKLREELGGTYTVQAGTEAGNEPYPHYRIVISYTSAPQRAKEMQDAVFAVIDSLRRFGPTAAELQAAKEVQRREVETGQQRNEYWAGMISGYIRNGWDLGALTQELRMSTEFTIESLHKVATEYLRDDRSIVVTSIPAGYQNATPAAGASNSGSAEAPR
jgi:zinc protease